MKKHILRAILSLLLLAYIVVATMIASDAHSRDVCTGMDIIVVDSTERSFVTPRELNVELQGLPDRAAGMRLVDINTDSIRSILSRIDKIEDVEVVTYTNGRIEIRVVPMRPVARVFDGDHSYYINREGKRISADARYRVDVPVILGSLDNEELPPQAIIPLLDYLESNTKWGEMVSMIKIASPSDVLLIPYVRGLVLNIGYPDPTTFDNKFQRLDRMFAEVIPVKGWDFYDTISVKWSNQAVAVRADKKPLPVGYVEVTNDEEIDLQSMLPDDGIAPGQAIPGSKPTIDKRIPGYNDLQAGKRAPAPAPAPTAPPDTTKH